MDDIAKVACVLGAAICMGLGSLSNGAGIGYVVTGAVRGMARQPRFNAATFRMMLIGQAGASTPSIFALVIAFFLFFKVDAVDPNSWEQAAAMLGAGLAVGLGSLGSGFGCGITGSKAVEATARNPKASGNVFMYMLVSQAWAQTPNIFAFMIGIMLMIVTPLVDPENAYSFISVAAKYLAAGICMGCGAIGPALSIGFIGGQVSHAVADNPAHLPAIRNGFLVGAAVAESNTVFALVVALMLYAH